jgi:hypothetical protein
MAFMLATSMTLAGVTLPDVTHAAQRPDAEPDLFCCAVPGSTLRISFSSLLANDKGQNLRVVSARLLPRFRRDVARFRVDRRHHVIIITFRNRIRDRFVDFSYRIVGRGGTDVGFAHIRRGQVSAS